MNENEYLGNYLKIYIAQATDEKIRKLRKTSGGALTAFLSFCLQRNYIDAVVLAELEKGLNSVINVATTPDDMIQLAHRNRIIVPDITKMEEIILSGDFKKVAVIVTPCIAEALRSMYQFPMTDYEITGRIKFIISSFCFGTFTYETFKSFLKEKLNIKPEDVTRVIVRGNMLYIQLQNETKSFNLSKISSYIQGGCLSCKDFTGKYSDISAGILPLKPPFTTLIFRNKEALSYFEEAIDKGIIKIASVEKGMDFIISMIISISKEKTLLSSCVNSI